MISFKGLIAHDYPALSVRSTADGVEFDQAQSLMYLWTKTKVLSISFISFHCELHVINKAFHV